MSQMSDRDFTRYFTYMVVAMAALAVAIFILANNIIVGDNPSKSAAAADTDTVAARIAPVGKLNLAGKVATSAVAPAQAADGKTTYNNSCAACHAAGVAGVPKMGDKAAWKDRIAQGNAKMYEHAIKGFTGKKGVMPPKGGFANLSDADVKAAVDHMVAGSK